MKRIPLEPGENTIDSCHFQKRPQGGWVMQWRIRPLNGEKPIKVTTQGNATQAELRRRAKAKAEDILKTHGRRRASAWKPSDDMSRYVLEEAIPAVKEKPDSVLRPRSRKRYIDVLKLYAEAARRFAIIDAAEKDNLKEAMLAIEREHGTATAKQAQKVVGGYVLEPLEDAHVIGANRLHGLKIDYRRDVRLGNKPKGGQALTPEERARCKDWLLAYEAEAMPQPKRGRYSAAQRTAIRERAVDVTLVQAECGLRIVEARRLRKSNVYERDGVLILEVTNEASKTHRGRECGVEDERIADRIRERLALLPEGDVPVFGSPAFPEREWDASNAQKAVRALYDEMADALGIPLLREVSSHVWRATLSSEWRDKGELPETRAAYFGHTPEVNERYYTSGMDAVALAKRHRKHAE